MDVSSCLAAQWPAPANIKACTFTRAINGSPSSAQLSAALGVDLPAATDLPQLEQVHGNCTVDIAEALATPAPVQADACYSAQPMQLCSVRTADCLPVLLCDRDGGEVAAVHAGWRGLAGGVVESALERFQAPPATVLAWLGPAISQLNFEVGSEVRDAFADAVSQRDRAATLACFRAEADKYRADLYALARLRLHAMGVQQVFGGQYCTYGEPQRFHSYRRDGTSAGRLYSVIIRCD